MYTVEKFVKAKREDWDDAPQQLTNREAVDAFRAERIASPEGQAVIAYFAALDAQPTPIVYKGRVYTVSDVETGELLRADLIARGFDGQTYLATGKNGATFLIYKTLDGRWIA